MPEIQKQTQSNKLSILLAIFIAGAIIAGAFYFNARGDGAVATSQTQAEDKKVVELENMNPITSDDHILGNPNAPVKIVEYSDFECPACKLFQTIMTRVMDDYGKSGKVAWVYRQFPIDILHPLNARKEAVASECAAELGGNDAFWKYTDRFFELTSSNNQTNIATVLPQIAREIGLDEVKFNSCLASKKYDKHVQDDLDNATATGGNGTPWSIVVTASGKKYPLSGAQPYEAVKQLIELALQEK